MKYFVLDEADRMLDMGFFDDIMKIVAELPAQRQTVMFSATLPPKIRQLAKQILRDPSEVNIAISKPLTRRSAKWLTYVTKTRKSELSANCSPGLRGRKRLFSRRRS